MVFKLLYKTKLRLSFTDDLIVSLQNELNLIETAVS